MLDRSSCERRVYRLATLLTGNPVAATRVIERVVGAQPDLRRLDSAHLDRLTVLRSREIKPATLADERLPRDAAETLAAIPGQQREAWVLARVYRTPSREVARAMDCSTAATNRHLELAEHALDAIATTADGTAKALLEYSMNLDVPDFYRKRQRKRRRWRWVRRIILIVLLSIAIIAALRFGPRLLQLLPQEGP